MAQLVAILLSDPALLPCVLRRVEGAVDLRAGAGKALGVGYFENGKVLLRKRPAPAEVSLGQLAGDVKSELLVAAAHGVGVAGFREEDTEPYRFRGWVFAGTGRIVPLGERQAVLASLPEHLQRGVQGPSDAELAFVATLARIQEDSRALDRFDLDPDVAAQGLAVTLGLLDERARAAGVPLPQTTAVLSNGRMIAAVRRGRPLSYSLIEGLQACDVCGLDRTATETDPRARPHRLVKAVVLATRPKSDGLQWIEIPDGHRVTVSRSLSIRLAPL